MATLELSPVVVVALPAALADLFARAHIPEAHHHAYADALMAEGFASPQALSLSWTPMTWRTAVLRPRRTSSSFCKLCARPW